MYDIEKAKKYYNDLCEIVENWKGSFSELSKEVMGHNLDENFFDVNFGNITATVQCRGGKIVVNKGFDVWDEGAALQYESWRKCPLCSKFYKEKEVSYLNIIEDFVCPDCKKIVQSFVKKTIIEIVRKEDK